MSALVSLLSCIRSLTFADLPAGLDAADGRQIAAGVLGLASESGATAAPLAAIAAEVERPAADVLAVLQALAAAGLVVLVVPPLSTAETWIVLWWAAFAGDGVTVNIYSGADRLFVCSDPSPDPDLDNIKTNKQTARARVRTREGGDEKRRIVALLTDPAVTAGLLARGSGAAVGCFSADKAAEIAGVVLRAGGSFDSVLANVCEWRREVHAGRVFSPLPALRARLERGFDGSITAADRAESWFVKHDPAAWALPFPAADGDGDGAHTVNVYSVPAEDVPSTPPGWDRFLQALRAQNGQIADLLVDASAGPAEDGGGAWVVRLGQAGASWAGWLQAKAARPVGRALAVLAGAPVALVEFQPAVVPAGDD